MDVRELDRRAVLAGLRVAERLDPAGLDGPTPCSEWTVRRLLEHMIVQHHGFAAAADGSRAGLDTWRPVPLGADPVGEYGAAVDRVLTAFAADGVLGREFWLPEIAGGVSLPAARAIGFHFLDYVAHGWDLARALDVPVDWDDDLLDAALLVAEQVPRGAVRTQPGAAFRPEHAPAPGAGTLARFLAAVGRSPSWPH